MINQLQNAVIHYLKEVLGLSLRVCHWDTSAAFPNYLKTAYKFEQCDILGQSFVLFFSQDSELTPGAIEKHLQWVEAKTGERGVFVADTLESYNRKRLIERKIPFIIPKNQLYLPDLALDLREHLRKAKKSVDKLSPTSQVIVLSYLLKRINEVEGLTPTGLAKQFPYTKMSMSRSLDELRSLGLVEACDERRNAPSQFVFKGEELWRQAKPFLRSPVTKRIYLDEPFHKSPYKSGESALDEMTMLASPKRKTWAMTSKEWKQIEKHDHIHTVPSVSKDLASAELEIWSYAPKFLSDGPTVDPLSLVLSVQHFNDERVEMATDELIDKMPW
jgi:hypothetical protein